jgi:DNA polymerase III subunit gamma/tau
VLAWKASNTQKVFEGSNPSLSASLGSMVARVGTFATTCRESRQARKGAAVADFVGRRISAGAGRLQWSYFYHVMSYLVLARKWRPKIFSEMVGQEHVLRALCNALDTDKVHHAFLFSGTRGVGKTTIARILAKSLNCETGVSSKPCGVCAGCREVDAGRCVDLIEVDAASRTKIDDTRELLDNVQYLPTRARYKVYLIDEVHMLSGHSFNALLKTLEEPPPHVKFLLATTDPQKLPVTILSRCLQFNLQRLPVALIAARLKFIALEEALEFEPAALMLVARAADGSLRDALSLLDQLIAFGAGKLGLADARAMLGTIDRNHLQRMAAALAEGNGQRLLAEVRSMDSAAPDYDRALADLAALLQRLAVMQLVPEAIGADEEFAAEEFGALAGSISAEDLQLYYQIALGGRRDLALAPDPRSGFEMTLLRMLAFRPAAAERISPSPTKAGQVALPQNAGAAPASISVENWASVIDAAQLSGMPRQFAHNCLPAGFADDVLTLRIDAAAADRRTRQIEEKIAQGLSQYFGRSIRLLFEVATDLYGTPARVRVQADEDNQLRARAAFEEDSTVRGLRERFGAAIDPSSVKPGR